MSQFDALLAELQGEVDTMAKALPPVDGDGDGDDDADPADTGAADKKIAAAAGSEPDGDEGDPDGGDGDGDEPQVMGKSMPAVRAIVNGQEVEAVDGTELVKSLMTQVEALGKKATGAEDRMVKALEGTLTVVKAQGALIKSLTEQVAALRGAGRGRKATVTVQDPPALTKSLPGADAVKVHPEQVMAKALSAQQQGRLTSLDVARVEGYMQAGIPLPANLAAALN